MVLWVPGVESGQVRGGVGRLETGGAPALAAAGDPARLDAHVAGLLARGPRVQGQGTQPGQVAGSVISARVPRTTTLQPVRVASSTASTSKATDSRSVAASSLDPGSVRKMTKSWSNT